MKEVISLLIVAVLFIYGTASLLAEESDSSAKSVSVLSKPIIPSIELNCIPDGGITTCGDGNGGGGFPG